MTKTEQEIELRKIEKMYYYNDFIEEDYDFYYEIGYLDAYFANNFDKNDVIFSDFY